MGSGGGISESAHEGAKYLAIEDSLTASLMREPLKPTRATPAMTIRRDTHLESGSDEERDTGKAKRHTGTATSDGAKR